MLRLRTFEHRQRAQHARLSASIGRNGDRSWCIWNRPARFRIKNVAVAYAVSQQEATRVATGRETANLQIQNRISRRFRLADRFDSNFPRFPTHGILGSHKIAAEIHQAAC